MVLTAEKLREIMEKHNANGTLSRAQKSLLNFLRKEVYLTTNANKGYPLQRKNAMRNRSKANNSVSGNCVSGACLAFSGSSRRTRRNKRTHKK
jgi:hypothetical protein